MFTHKTKKLPKNTVEILVDIPWVTIEKHYDSAFDAIRKEVEVQGFRRGNVPRDIAKKHIQKEKVYQRLIRDLLPEIYSDIVKKEDLKPIINPKIELVKALENKDWEVKITLAEKPKIELGDYKDKIKEQSAGLRAKSKKADIWVPGKGGLKNDKTQNKQEVKEDQQKLLNSVLENLLKTVKVELSDLIIEEDLNSRLTKLVDDVQKIGMSMDAYLKSKNTTMDELRAGFSREIEDTFKLEFIISEIAEQEHIQVDSAELDKMFDSISDPKEKETAKKNAYFYAMILRKQKVIDFLLEL